MKTERYQPIVYFIALIAALGGLLFGYDTGVISGVILFLQEEFHLSDFGTEVIVSAILIGAIVGAIFSGRFVSMIGRKGVIIFAACLFICGTLLFAFATSVPIVILARTILGLAIGASSFAVPLYISELSPPKIRGFLVSLNQVMITAGIFISYLVNLYFAEHSLWRWMVGIAAIPALFLGIGMLFLPDSPRLLYQKNKKEEARSILTKIHGENLADFELSQIAGSVQKMGKKRTPLFQKKYAMPIFIGVFLAIFQQITGINTIIYYAPIIFKLTGLTSNVVAILATAGVGFVNLVMTLIAIRFIDRLGRRPLLLLGIGGMIIGLVCISLSFAFAAPSPLLGWITAFSLFLYVASFAIGLGPIFWLLIAEIYPLSIRGRAMSFATMMNWAANLLVAMTFLSLLHYLSAPITFALYAALSIICWLFVYYFIAETKKKSLEELEKRWD